MTLFDPAALKDRVSALEKKLEDPAVWSDREGSGRISRELKAVREKLTGYDNALRRLEDASVLAELAVEEDDEETLLEAGREIEALKEDAERLRLQTLLKGDYDANSAILALHAGAGGTEAQDWVAMLYRMFTRWAEKNGYGVRVLDFLEGEEAGIKSVTFEVDGPNAYGYLKSEKGVHRLVRISPFDASGRRHTSFASLDVMPVIEEDVEVEINPDELRVDTYRSSGAGGQHVNKTDSAIRITHLPTGIVVQCQNERSQTQNRETAMRMLRSRLVELKERENMEKMAALKGEMKRIEWGSQIRSYVFQPYTMVKDHRTGAESGNIDAVMDGGLDPFITAFLQQA
ncbi:MAG: peptide chain release factor 2 [Clostridiales bacterium]|nr:peptide chain release factor 2 [Clostridiales bacterium]